MRIPKQRRVGRTRLDPTSLQFFVSVIEEGTIASVAELHNTAASAVSKRLSDLEALFGTPLVRRTKRGMEPTMAGTVLENLARGVLDDLDEIYMQMQEYATGIHGHVHLLANLSSITGFLPTELKAFLDHHPHVRVQIEESVSPTVIRSVSEGRADVGLFIPGDEPLQLEILPYHQDAMVVITPKGHPLEGVEAVRFSDTLDYDYIGLHEEAVLQLVNAATTARKRLRLKMQVSSCDAMCAMVGAGLGIGILPHSAIRAYELNNDIAVIALDENWSRRELKIGVRSYAALPTAAKLLVDHLAKGAKELLTCRK